METKSFSNLISSFFLSALCFVLFRLFLSICCAWSDKIRCLKRATRKDFLYEGTFHEAIAPALVLSQIMAVMPVIGICKNDASHLRFSWKALRTVYAVIVFVMATVYAGLSLRTAFEKVDFDLIGLFF